MRFNYREYGDVMRPVIPVIISYHGSYFQYSVLIDSGADRCLFDSEVASALGISREGRTTREAMGVGGKISTYYMHPVTMTVGGQSYQIEAGFMDNVGGGIVPYGFVGQKGFFDKFVIIFDSSRNEVELQGYR